MIPVLLHFLLFWHSSQPTDFVDDYDDICAAFRQGPGYDDAEAFMTDLQREAEDLQASVEEAARQGERGASQALADRCKALGDVLALLTPGGADQLCYAAAAPIFADLGLTPVEVTGHCVPVYRVEAWDGQLLSFWVHNKRPCQMAGLNWAVNQGPFPAESGRFTLMSQHLREMTTLLPGAQDPNAAFAGKPYRMGEIRCQWEAQPYKMGCE